MSGLRTTRLRREEIVLRDGWTRTGVEIEHPWEPRQTLWYRARLPAGWHLSESSDALLLVPLYKAMRAGGRLEVEGEVSPALLANLEEFQRFWCRSYPSRFRPVEIVPEREVEQPPGPPSAVAAFSGGVDSCFTVHRHLTGTSGRRTQRILAGVMVHGFDIPIEEEEGFAAAAAGCEELLASVDLPLIRMATNVREVEHAWDDVVGAAVASCLHLLQPNAASGLVAASYPYDRRPLWGSNPISDPLLSSSSLRTVHDGGGFTRDEKVAAIAGWPAALEHLRVCWRSPRRDRNCGRCLKCIRTILAFRTYGLGLPACFDRDVTDAQIRALGRLDRLGREDLRILLDAVGREQAAGSWVRAVRSVYYRNVARDRLETLVSRR